MKTQRIRILVVDDHFMVRVGLNSALASESDLQVVGEARDGAEAIAEHARLRPDVVLMDGILPDLHGIEVTRRICLSHPEARVILVSINDTAEDVHRAMEAGACGYIPKSCEKDTIVRAIRAVADGEHFLLPNLARKLADRKSRVGLSARESEVLRLIAQGKANKQIAASLGLSEATVKTHIAHIFSKLDAPDRTRAVTVAMERGLLRM
ncbi:MAG: response regulator transcription factor [Opitutaceae bacterium]|nr:response regulator transcription factor [Opitutaceae bacterium]